MTALGTRLLARTQVQQPACQPDAIGNEATLEQREEQLAVSNRPPVRAQHSMVRKEHRCVRNICVLGSAGTNSRWAVDR
jgi:hypothetical protein